MKTLALWVVLAALAVPVQAQQAALVSWDAPTEGGAPAGYLVQAGPSPGATTASLNVGLVTSTTVTLNPGTWYLRVLAYNAVGQSPPSDEVSVTITQPPTPVDCVLGPWTFQSATAWGTCTSGVQTRFETWTRAIVVPPANGGLACGATQETRIASQPCSAPPVNCVMSPWTFNRAGDWIPPCAPTPSTSDPASAGRMPRPEIWTRTVITPAANGGTPCPTSLTQSRTAYQSCTYVAPLPVCLTTPLTVTVTGWGGATGALPLVYTASQPIASVVKIRNANQQVSHGVFTDNRGCAITKRRF